MQIPVFQVIKIISVLIIIEDVFGLASFQIPQKEPWYSTKTPSLYANRNRRKYIRTFTNTDQPKEVLSNVLTKVRGGFVPLNDVRCKLSERIEPTTLCNYDVICTMKNDPPDLPFTLEMNHFNEGNLFIPGHNAQVLMFMDLETVKVYKTIMVQFVPVLAGIIESEEQMDHSDTYTALLNFQRAFIGLIKTLRSAEKYFEKRSITTRELNVPEVFHPFPSNDRCAREVGLTLDEQKFRAIKSIWIFFHLMHNKLFRRCYKFQANRARHQTTQF